MSDERKIILLLRGFSISGAQEDLRNKGQPNVEAS